MVLRNILLLASMNFLLRVCVSGQHHVAAVETECGFFFSFFIYYKFCIRSWFPLLFFCLFHLFSPQTVILVLHMVVGRAAGNWATGLTGALKGRAKLKNGNACFVVDVSNSWFRANVDDVFLKYYFVFVHHRFFLFCFSFWPFFFNSFYFLFFIYS